MDNEETRNALGQLFEFGYVDFEKNMNLLAKYNFNLDMVMNHLLDNMN